MWWVWVLVFGLLIILGFEIRSKDVYDHVLEMEDSVRKLWEDISKLREDIMLKK